MSFDDGQYFDMIKLGHDLYVLSVFQGTKSTYGISWVDIP
jgi:hypothetical protein